MNERLVNLLLLSIIDAHDPATQTASREQRLAQAKEALFGIKQGAGREPLDDDEALLEMYQIQLRQFAPTIVHAMKGAYARMHGEAFDEPPPPEPFPKSMR